MRDIEQIIGLPKFTVQFMLEKHKWNTFKFRLTVQFFETTVLSTHDSVF